MSVHRLISVLLLVEARGTIKAKEIASKLEVSVRTVYRDIDALCEAGIPLTTVPGPKGGIRLMEGYSGSISSLEEDDIINLYLSGMGIKPDGRSEMALKLNNALLKLQRNLPSKENEYINDIKRRFYFDDTPWWGEKHVLTNIDTLMRAVFLSRVLRITYRKTGGETSVRTVRPYGIVVKDKQWYMAAYCEKSGAVRVFKCERITESEILDEKFILPKNFSVEEYWNKSEEQFKCFCDEKEKYIVVLKLNKSSMDIIKDMKILETEEDGDNIFASVNMYDYEYAAANIMKIADLAEVISPLELRAFIMDKINSIIKIYRGR